MDRVQTAGGILAIETSQARGSVAWSASPEAEVIEALFPVGLVHGREILPQIEELRARSGFARSDIQTVAVSAGPGSFTGARIGVAAGKALAYALGCRVLSISSLEAIARNVLLPSNEYTDSTEISDATEIAVLLDARRALLYGARFRREGDTLVRVSADVAAEVSEYFATLPPETHLLGDGARSLPGAEKFAHFAEDLDLPRATTVVTLARERLAALAAGGARPAEWDDAHALVPLYLRRTPAEEAREAKS